MLVFCAFLISLTIGSLVESALTTRGVINSHGIIAAPSTMSGYECGNYNSTHYYARNLERLDSDLLFTDAADTIRYALGKLTYVRTWQEALILKGNFFINSTITLSQGNVFLDCRQATLTLTAETILFEVQNGGHYTFKGNGGHIIGPSTSSSNNIAFRFTNCFDCLIDGFDISGFSGNNNGIFLFGIYSSNMVIQNCVFHDNDNSGHLTILNQGYNEVLDCVFTNPSQGIFVSSSATNNLISGCEFSGWWQGGFGHAIYLDGTSGLGGYNTITNCSFHDPLGQAALHIKCQCNDIYDNVFYSFPQQSLPLSIYSEYSPSYANDNTIHDNSFTDCYYGIKVGHNPANYPTLRNKIYDNLFTRVTGCIILNPWSGAITTVEDTMIYYNSFVDCSKIFPLSESSPSLVKNTVVAFNDFGGTVADLAILQKYVNSMVYDNIGMADYNVPSPLPILPR